MVIIFYTSLPHSRIRWRAYKIEIPIQRSAAELRCTGTPFRYSTHLYPKKMKPPIFVYGTLCSPQVLQVLLGRTTTVPLLPARLWGHARYPVQNVRYPGTIPTPHQPENHVDGFLLEVLTLTEGQLLDWFEGDEYDRVMVQVEVLNPDANTTRTAEVYLWKEHLMERLEMNRRWCLQTFQQEHLELYLETTVRPCRVEMEQRGMTSTMSDSGKDA